MSDATFSPAILHVDMDAFFAAVEVLHRPELVGKPVVVGGTGQRGVVASCTYEARAFGVRSAMPTVRARQLCPHAIFLNGNHPLYAEVSEQLRQVLSSVTPLVEPIGLDEAFLDVTGARRLLGPPDDIARHLRRRISDQLSLPCSIGIGRSKMVAKLASRAAKPKLDGRTVRPGPGVVMVAPDDEPGFLRPLPVEALWGVGPATAARLRALGVRTVGDLAVMPEQTVLRRVGKAHGTHLVDLARGHDPSPVVPDRPTKSIGHEETFAHDLYDRATLHRHALRMAQAVADHLRRSSLTGKTVAVKVKFADFSLVTRSHTLSCGVDTAAAIGAVAGALLDAVDPSPGVRLLGVSAAGLAPAEGDGGAPGRQLSFELAAASSAGGPGAAGGPDGDPGADDVTGAGPADVEAAGARAGRLQFTWREVSAAVDAIRARYGRAAVGSVAMLGDGGLRVPDRLEAPWGPSGAGDGGSDGPADGRITGERPTT